MSDRPTAADKMSRRDFLKWGAVMTGGLLGALITVRGEVDRAFGLTVLVDALINFDSGISQITRRQKLDEAATKGMNNPEIFTSWLKFIGLEIYAKANGWVLAEATIRQFMYGGGEKIDVKTIIPQSLRNEPGWLDTNKSFDLKTASDQQILEAFSAHSLNKALFVNPEYTNRNLPLEVFPKGKNLYRILSKNKLPANLTISAAGDGANQDGLYSMNMFTQTFTGKMTEITGPPQGGFWGWQVTGKVNMH